MAEAVASHLERARGRVRFWRRLRTAPLTSEERQQQVTDFERLVERLLEKVERMDRQLRDAKEENRKLVEENKRLKGE